MISSASTLLLATMVFNAASVLGAPIRFSERQPSVVPRAVSEPAAAVYVREDVFPEFIKARDTAEIPSAPVQKRDRQYPRRALYDLHEKREPAPIAANVERDEVVEVNRRFPRKVYQDFYQKREPATTIKEFSLKTVKTTTFDSPADAAAYLGAGGNPNAPKKSETSTSVSSSATTIGAIPTPPAGAPGAPGAVPSPAPTPVPSPDAGGNGVPTSSAAPSPTPTPDSPVTPPAGTPGTPGTDQTPPPPADPATPTPTPGNGEPAPSPSPSSCATPPADGSPCPSSTPSTPGSPDPSTPTPDASGNPPASRREVKADTQPIARRMAVSGASLASAVRRQLNQS